MTPQRTQPAAKPTAAKPTATKATATKAAATKPTTAKRVTRARTTAPSPAVTRVATEKRCPRCEQALLDLVTPDGGEAAYACPLGGCGFTLPVGVRRRAAPCPRCGGVMLARRDGGEAAWTCARATCGHRVAPTVAAGG